MTSAHASVRRDMTDERHDLGSAEATRHGAAAFPQPARFTAAPARRQLSDTQPLRRHPPDYVSGPTRAGRPRRRRVRGLRRASQRDAHAPLHETFRLAEQAQVGARHGKRVAHALERDPALVGRRRSRPTRPAYRAPDRPAAENRTRVQLEFRLTLRRERDEALYRAAAHLGEPHVAAHEQLDAEHPAPAERLVTFVRDLARLRAPPRSSAAAATIRRSRPRPARGRPARRNRCAWRSSPDRSRAR